MLKLGGGSGLPDTVECCGLVAGNGFNQLLRFAVFTWKHGQRKKYSLGLSLKKKLRIYLEQTKRVSNEKKNMINIEAL